MAEIQIPCETHMGATAELLVDEDQDMRVPTSTDESGLKRAGDLVPGDRFFHGRRIVFTVVAP